MIRYLLAQLALAIGIRPPWFPWLWRKGKFRSGLLTTSNYSRGRVTSRTTQAGKLYRRNERVSR